MRPGSERGGFAEQAPVLEDRESRKLSGTVSRRDILGLYARELVAGRGEQPLQP